MHIGLILKLYMVVYSFIPKGIRSILLRKYPKILFISIKILKLYWREYHETNIVPKEFIRNVLDDIVCFEVQDTRYIYRKISVLLELYLYNYAYSEFLLNGELLDKSEIKRLDIFFKRFYSEFQEIREELEAIWDNCLEYDENSGDKVYLTIHPAIFFIDAYSEQNEYIYQHVFSVYKNIFKVLKNDCANNIVMLPQFSFYNLFSHKSKLVISFHTKSNEQNNRMSLRVKESPFLNYFNFDECGYSGWAKFSKIGVNDIYNCNVTSEMVDYTFKQKHKEFVLNRVSKYLQKMEYQELPFNDYILLALQIRDDSVAELAYIDTYRLLRYMVALSDRYKFNLVIKRHPFCKSKLIRKLLDKVREKDSIFISDASIHVLIPNARKIVTVNSGVGIESLLYLKPVITTGLSDYHMVTKLVKNKEELMGALFDFEVDTYFLKKFIYIYFENLVYKSDIIKISSIVRGYSSGNMV